MTRWIDYKQVQNPTWSHDFMIAQKNFDCQRLLEAYPATIVMEGINVLGIYKW